MRAYAVSVFPIPYSAYTEPGQPGYGDDRPWRWMAVVTEHGNGGRQWCKRARTKRRVQQWSRLAFRELSR